MTLSKLYEEGKHYLTGQGIESPAYDAGQLLFSVFGVRPGQLPLHGGREAAAADERLFWERLHLRAQGHPLQYILGEWEFYSLPFFVGEGVLIPRPETELLVEECLSLLPEDAPCVVADLCSGSGCIAVSVAHHRPQSRVYAVELSAAAAGFLRRNIGRNAAENVILLQQDVLLGNLPEKADVIVCNPPYIESAAVPLLQEEVRHEPQMALDGGADGLHFYREIPRLYYDRLHAGGTLLFELGIGQAEAVRAILIQQGYTHIRVCRDLSGIERVIAAQKPQTAE